MPDKNWVSTGGGSKFSAVEVQDKNGNWRTRIISQRTKFDEEAKGRFIDSYKEFARIGDACAAAGITRATYQRHLKQDDDFAEACMAAEEEYRAKLIAHHQDLVFNGTKKVTYDRNGNVVGEEQIYPIPLIQMELRKHDEGYRDKKEMDVNVSGGVLVAPADVATIDDWEARFTDNQVIDGEAVEVDGE